MVARALVFLRAISTVSIATALNLAIADEATSDPRDDTFWKLTWSDEFDGPVNERYWDYQLGPRKDSVQVRENAFTEDGHLVLRTSLVNGQYRTGFLRTRRLSHLLVSQKYGYFEARIKLDTAPGQWAAFWLMPKGSIHNKDGSGRDGAEIDIVEGFSREPNSTVSQAVHFDGYGGPRQQSLHNTHEMSGAVEDWRTYGLRWCAGSYTWFIDGQKTWKVSDPKAISQVEQYLLLTTEVVLNASWVGEMDNEQLPADTKVDFVRVYESRADQECDLSDPPRTPTINYN